MSSVVIWMFEFWLYGNLLVDFAAVNSRLKTAD